MGDKVHWYPTLYYPSTYRSYFHLNKRKLSFLSHFIIMVANSQAASKTEVNLHCIKRTEQNKVQYLQDRT